MIQPAHHRDRMTFLRADNGHQMCIAAMEMLWYYCIGRTIVLNHSRPLCLVLIVSYLDCSQCILRFASLYRLKSLRFLRV